MTRKDLFWFSTYGYMTQFYAPCPILLTEAYRGTNSTWKLLYGRYDSFEFPLIFQQEKSYGGKKMTDFLNTGWGAKFTPISDKVLHLLVENNITGWKTYPIEVYDKFGNEIKGYHGLSITGRCKDIDLSLLDEKVNYQYRKDGPVYQYYRGYPLDLSTWDGCDMFLFSGTSALFITRRVYNIFKKNKITNFAPENVMDFIMDNSYEEFLRAYKFKNSEAYNW